MSQSVVPLPFILRRIHSLLGLWLVIFLIEHLLVNSQLALFFGEKETGFIHLVNTIHALPYLPFIEWTLIGVPLIAHGLWGLHYLAGSYLRGGRSDGSRPLIPSNGRNRAYYWQRIASLILGVGLILHVGKFRFLTYPASLHQGSANYYAITVPADPKLYFLAEEIGVKLFSPSQIEELKATLLSENSKRHLEEVVKTYPPDSSDSSILISSVRELENNQNTQELISFLEAQKQAPHELVALGSQMGQVTLLSVRETFKTIFTAICYTAFVLAACFHAFNGLWTFLITWGVILKVSAQKMALIVTWSLMGTITLLGMMAIWGTYYFNLTG
ncbi:succinate dehydrogenase [Rhabdochlamydiaceae symbiont of Dictyostelium giganteum]|uniref:succinate dehydrogenase n=1 Tax=Rhabdochlamydiaceae symbiont of Dictyostelium giganteum TaxID=3342349 RepID=UPI00384ACAD4